MAHLADPNVTSAFVSGILCVRRHLHSECAMRTLRTRLGGESMGAITIGGSYYRVSGLVQLVLEWTAPPFAAIGDVHAAAA
jgi:hypothetical protein